MNFLRAASLASIAFIGVVYLLPCLIWLPAVTIIVLLAVYSLCRRRRYAPEGRVVFVVGADSGFGFSSARHLREEGCRVVAGCVDTEGFGAKELRRHAIDTVPVDVRSEESVAAAVEAARTIAGEAGLWAVVFNAGVLVLGHLAWLTNEQVERMVEVNYLGALRVARAVLPALARSSGRLVLVSSPCASIPGPEISVYSSTKAAINALARSLRLEWRRLHVDVSLLTPGDMARATNILARQPADNDAMFEQMNEETRRRDEDVFTALRDRLAFARPQQPAVLTTPRLRRAMTRAVLDVQPLVHYTALEAGVCLWKLLDAVLPESVHEYLVLRSYHYWVHQFDWEWIDLNNLI